MIFLAFIFIPILEIFIFMSAGSYLGKLNTILIILITALTGIFFVRKRGIKLLFYSQRNLSQGVVPTEEIKGGIFLLISGLLLITPGFFTDIIGFLMFVPQIQKIISKIAYNYFQSKIYR